MIPVVALLAAVATFPAPAADFTGGEGRIAFGRILFEGRCAVCHTVDSLAGLGGRLRNDLRSIDERMGVVGLLWDQEVADLRAFLDGAD